MIYINKSFLATVFGVERQILKTKKKEGKYAQDQFQDKQIWVDPYVKESSDSDEDED
jgi:hypothetical protein